MKKRRLKKWVRVAIEVIIFFVVTISIALIWANRVEYFNNNIEKCGSNYCD